MRYKRQGTMTVKYENISDFPDFAHHRVGAISGTFYK